MIIDLVLVGSNLSARIDRISSIRVIISFGSFTPIVFAIFFALFFLENFVSSRREYSFAFIKSQDFFSTFLILFFFKNEKSLNHRNRE